MQFLETDFITFNVTLLYFRKFLQGDIFVNFANDRLVFKIKFLQKEIIFFFPHFFPQKIFEIAKYDMS